MPAPEGIPSSLEGADGRVGGRVGVAGPGVVLKRMGPWNRKGLLCHSGVGCEERCSCCPRTMEGSSAGCLGKGCLRSETGQRFKRQSHCSDIFIFIK